MRAEQNLAKWNKIKQNGRWNYILKHGIISYGLIYFIAFVFIGPWFDSKFTFDFIYKDTFLIKVIVFAILSPVIGAFLSYSLWRTMENKYKSGKL